METAVKATLKGRNLHWRTAKMFKYSPNGGRLSLLEVDFAALLSCEYEKLHK